MEFPEGACYVSRPVRVTVLLAISLVLASCKAGDPPRARRSTGAEPAVTAAKALPSPVPVPSPEKPAAPAENGVKWKGNIEWHTWEDALPLAKKTSKPIFLLVFADWCPHCRDLGNVFGDPEIADLSKRFIMVRQNHDDSPPWLAPYTQKYGGYVPRIFFFGPDGKLREDITSGHPKYPFFYAAEQPAVLKSAMRRVTSS